MVGLFVAFFHRMMDDDSQTYISDSDGDSMPSLDPLIGNLMETIYAEKDGRQYGVAIEE